MNISDIIRVPFGYILEWLYTFTNNYGLALILFAIAIKLILLPTGMKSKKSMMKMSRVAPLTKALEVKYGDDKAKYQTEVMKLYKEEGVSTTGGCLWSFIPLLILIPLYQVVREPMIYMMHLTVEQSGAIVGLLTELGADLGSNTYYAPLAAASQLGNYLPQIREALPELANATLTPINFEFLGLNMGAIPTWKFWTLSGWGGIGLFIIPVVSAVINWLSMFISQKMNATVATNDKGEQDKDAASAVNSSMKSMNYLMPLMSLWMGFQFPAAMSIYWITQGIIGVLQEVILTKHYRKIYDAEDEQRRMAAYEAQLLEEAKEMRRAERRAERGDAVDPNTSKKKLASKGKNFGPVIEGKLTPEQREALKNGTLVLNEDEEESIYGKSFSGDPERPYCRGRAYKPRRYGRDGSEITDFSLDEE